MKTIELNFDISSGFTYLAMHNIQPIAKKYGASIYWKPILLGGVFNAVNQGVYALRENPQNPKLLFVNKSLEDWAKWSGLPLDFPTKFHPAKSIHAMRFCCALEDRQDILQKFAMAAVDGYWTNQQNIDDPEVLVKIANSIGEDGNALLAEANQEHIKARLRANTQSLIDRGGFGSPTIFVNGDDMYFGNDQMPLIERALC